MSSSNRVRLAVIPESSYGVTPGAGDFTEARMISEDLSGTPQTVESAGLRSDRQNSGQINTGLELSGGFDFELSADTSIKLLIEHAMMSALVAEDVHTATLAITTSGTVLTSTGDLTIEFADGDVAVLGGFATAANNTPVVLSNVTSGSATIVGEGLVDEGSGTTATLASYHEIGTIEKSLSVSKEFLDLGARNIAYTGMRVTEMSMAFAFGSIVTGRFGLAGNGYSTPALPLTDSRTVNAAGSDQSLDASNGFGWLMVDDVALDICVESLDFKLSNNLAAQNCIGSLAPTNQVPGSAGVEFNATIHLGATSFDTFMAAKVAQTGMRIAFYTMDEAGQGYCVVLERVQLSFPDPATTGKDATVTIAASGVASYDATAQKTMRIYII